MKLGRQKKWAAQILKCSPKRIVLSADSLQEIKESITKADLRGLIHDNIIIKKQAKGVSRARANKRAAQKRKGRRKGHGSAKGRHTASVPRKSMWMSRIRVQRNFLKILREKGHISTASYRELFSKSKGGFFRNVRHIKLYIEEHNLVNKDGKK
ncbi:50S ribosomal protein L19e [Candidatus Woesearchaeota archaeon]|nr:50S ribosomal protein L19e [Candidatus Woesearchaeota archaeon]